jgi:S-adenosyl-L-methionine hydrolase (adenosine-forming)
MAPVITFLSDYGVEDDFVGVCHGVIARLAPDVRVIDITHGIDRHDVRTGALVLRRALPYFPAGVHLAVIDPEVGGERRAVALRTTEEDRILVGPDNGLLALAAERFGGAAEAVDIAGSPLRLERSAATFHGRDLFAPVAAHLAAGGPLTVAGEPLDVGALSGLHLPRAQLQDGILVAHALGFDRFGNVMLDVEPAELGDAGLEIGRRVLVNDEPARHVRTFVDVPPGELLLYEDAYCSLALAVNRGSAAGHLGVDLDAEIRIRPA